MPIKIPAKKTTDNDATAQQGLATVHVENKSKGTESQHQEPVGEMVQVTGLEPIANVGIEMSMSINLGNYNNVKVGCSLVMPCVVSERDDTFEEAKKWIEARMETLVNEAAESAS